MASQGNYTLCLIAVITYAWYSDNAQDPLMAKPVGKMGNYSCVHHSNLNPADTWPFVGDEALPAYLGCQSIMAWTLTISDRESKIANSSTLTDNEANFAEMIIVATSHHGSHCVIDHSHNVSVKVLSWHLHASSIKHTHVFCQIFLWRMWDISPYLSFFDRCPEKLDYIFSLNPTWLEGFGPGQQNTLQSWASFSLFWPHRLD